MNAAQQKSDVLRGQGAVDLKKPVVFDEDMLIVFTRSEVLYLADLLGVSEDVAGKCCWDVCVGLGEYKVNVGSRQAKSKNERQHWNALGVHLPRLEKTLSTPKVVHEFAGLISTPVSGLQQTVTALETLHARLEDRAELDDPYWRKLRLSLTKVCAALSAPWAAMALVERLRGMTLYHWPDLASALRHVSASLKREGPSMRGYNDRGRPKTSFDLVWLLNAYLIPTFEMIRGEAVTRVVGDTTSRGECRPLRLFEQFAEFLVAKAHSYEMALAAAMGQRIVEQRCTHCGDLGGRDLSQDANCLKNPPCASCGCLRYRLVDDAAIKRALAYRHGVPCDWCGYQGTGTPRKRRHPNRKRPYPCLVCDMQHAWIPTREEIDAIPMPRAAEAHIERHQRPSLSTHQVSSPMFASS